MRVITLGFAPFCFDSFRYRLHFSLFVWLGLHSLFSQLLPLVSLRVYIRTLYNVHCAHTAIVERKFFQSLLHCALYFNSMPLEMSICGCGWCHVLLCSSYTIPNQVMALFCAQMCDAFVSTAQNIHWYILLACKTFLRRSLGMPHIKTVKPKIASIFANDEQIMNYHNILVEVRR